MLIGLLFFVANLVFVLENRTRYQKDLLLCFRKFISEDKPLLRTASTQVKKVYHSLRTVVSNHYFGSIEGDRFRQVECGCFFYEITDDNQLLISESTCVSIKGSRGTYLLLSKTITKNGAKGTSPCF